MAVCSNCGSQDIAEGQKFCTVCGARLDDGSGTLSPLPSFPMETPTSLKVPGVANFWWRLLSYLIDVIILFVCIALPLRSASLNFYVLGVVILITTFLYGVLLLTYWGGKTLGMAICRLRCVRASDGGPLELSRAARRGALRTLLLAIGEFYHYVIYKYPDHAQKLQNTHHTLVRFALDLPFFLDILWVAWDSRRQALHDKFAGTLVMRSPMVPKPVTYEIVSPHDTPQ